LEISPFGATPWKGDSLAAVSAKKTSASVLKSNGPGTPADFFSERHHDPLDPPPFTALAATSVAALGVSAANAAVIVGPTINIPTVRPMLPAVRQGQLLPATHAPTLPATHAPTLPATHAPVLGVVLPADHVAIPPHPTSVVAAELNGKSVIKVSYANGNELTVLYLSADAQHIVGAVSSISALATHAPPQNVATAQPVANQPATNPPARV
jgi:hypothetical protein